MKKETCNHFSCDMRNRILEHENFELKRKLSLVRVYSAFIVIAALTFATLVYLHKG